MNFRSKDKTVLFSVVVILAVLFALDLGIRKKYPIPKKGYGVWAAFPGSELHVIISPDKVKTIHRYNMFGFRGADFPLEPPSMVRIACVGDSYTEGIGVHEKDAWPSILSRVFSHEGWEVINLGDGGSQMDRYSEIIAKVAVPLKSTDIVLCVLTGDLRNGPDVHPRLTIATEFYNPFFSRGRWWVKPLAVLFPGWIYLFDRVRGRWPIQRGSFWGTLDEEAFMESVVKELSTRRHVSPSKARRIVQEHRSMISGDIISASLKREFNPGLIRLELLEPFIQYRATASDMRIEVDDLVQSTYSWIKWYSQTCKMFNIRAWLLYFPVGPLVCEGPFGIFSNEYYDQAPNVLNDTSVSILLAQACERYDVRFIDASQVLREHCSEKLYYRWDTHPTSTAHELVGKSVAEKMHPIISSIAGP